MKVGEHGKERRQFYEPRGIAVDTGGMVYVLESGYCCVSVFTSEGHYVTSFGMKGRSFKFPTGVAVDNNGVVYVCDNCLEVFKLL